MVLILRQDDISVSILSQSHHPRSRVLNPGVPKKCEDLLLVQTQHAVLRKTPPTQKKLYIIQQIKNLYEYNTMHRAPKKNQVKKMMLWKSWEQKKTLQQREKKSAQTSVLKILHHHFHPQTSRKTTRFRSSKVVQCI